MKRTIHAPAPVGMGVVNHIRSVILDDNEDVEWCWSHLPHGRFVSGYQIVPKPGIEVVGQEQDDREQEAARVVVGFGRQRQVSHQRQEQGQDGATR